MTDHIDQCGCVLCRVERAYRHLARAEEMAGREGVGREARPDFWAPRPGTAKAIDRAYGPKKRRTA